MARPRLVSDDAILDATRQVLAELGPVKLTLAAVGSRVGLAPPTLMPLLSNWPLATVRRNTSAVLPEPLR